MSRGGWYRRIAVVMALAPAAVADPAVDDRRATVRLPAEAQRAFFDVYDVDPADRASFVAHAKLAAVDLDGDGKTDYLVEYQIPGAQDDSAPGCNSVVLAARGSGFDYVQDFDCCHYQVSPATAGHGGRVDCRDPHSRMPPLVYRGVWPKQRDRSITQSQIRASFDQGMQRYKAGAFADAEPLMCRYRVGSGNTHDPELVNGCATVLLREHKLDEAEHALELGTAEHPGYHPFYANLGTLWEARGELQKALFYYRKYVAAAAPGAGRDAIDARITALASRLSHG